MSAHGPHAEERVGIKIQKILECINKCFDLLEQNAETLTNSQRNPEREKCLQQRIDPPDRDSGQLPYRY